MSNSDRASAAPEEISINGQTFKLSRLRMSGVGVIQGLINQLPRPNVIPELRRDLDGLPPELIGTAFQEAIVRMVNWPPDLLFNPEAILLVARNPLIMQKVFYHALRPNHPEIDEHSAGQLYGELDQGDFNKVLRIALDLKEAKGPKDEGADSDGSTTGSPTGA